MALKERPDQPHPDVTVKVDTKLLHNWFKHLHKQTHTHTQLMVLMQLLKAAMELEILTFEP